MLTHERAFAAQRVFGQPGPALGVTLLPNLEDTRVLHLHVESSRGRNHHNLVTSASGSQEVSPSPPGPSPERERGDPSKACVLESRMATSFRR
jgi:hypothetical protein